MKTTKAEEARIIENNIAETSLRFHFVTPPVLDSNYGVRYDKRHGSRWMLENKSIIRHGTVRYLQIKELGLGVVEVRLRPEGKINTFVVKEWEKA